MQVKIFQACEMLTTEGEMENAWPYDIGVLLQLK